MVTYLVFGMVSSLIASAIYLDTPKIIYNFTVDKFKKWDNLKQLVSTGHTSKFKIMYVSCQLIIKAIYLSLIQKMNNSVKKLDRNVYEVSYLINGKVYKMVVTPIRGPSPVLQISNDSYIDVTDIVIPYLGPRYDWHNITLSPKFFGYKSLTFELLDGSSKTFSDNDNVTIDSSLKRKKDIT